MILCQTITREHTLWYSVTADTLCDEGFSQSTITRKRFACESLMIYEVTTDKCLEHVISFFLFLLL